MTVQNTRRGETQPNKSLMSSVENRTFALFPLEGCLTHNAACTTPLAGEVRRSRAGGVSKSISSLESGRRPDEGERKTKTAFINLIRHPLTCPRITTLRGRLSGHPLPQGRGGTRSGFTLIELLVVVLIIGILAEVAMPQYQVAVAKAKLARLIPLAEALYQAQQVYFLANGEFAESLDELDVELPSMDAEDCTHNVSTGGDTYTCSNLHLGISDGMSDIVVRTQKTSYVKAFKTKVYDWGLTLEAGKTYCFADENDKVSKTVCKSLSGELLPGHTIYYVLP